MRILNFGSLNIDYVYSLEHIVTPGETISSSTMNKFCGGKGLNQSIALAKAGAAVYHAGCIGSDGEFLLDEMKKANVNTDFVMKSPIASGHAIIQVDKNGQNSIVLFSGANGEITEQHIERVLSHFDSEDWLLIQNEINNVDLIVKSAYKKGMKIILNPSPMNEKINALPLEMISCFILNETEGSQITGKGECDEILSELKTRFPNSEIVLTLGKKGAVYLYKDEQHTEPIVDSKVVDTTGAGDTFTGYFLASRAKGLSSEGSMKRATAASSIAVSRSGAAVSIPFYDEVDKFLEY